MWNDAELNISAEIDLGEGGEFGQLPECRDIGYLVAKTRDKIILSVSRCYTDNTTRHSNTIPRNWVKEIIFLAPSPKETPNAEHLAPAEISG